MFLVYPILVSTNKVGMKVLHNILLLVYIPYNTRRRCHRPVPDNNFEQKFHQYLGNRKIRDTHGGWGRSTPNAGIVGQKQHSSGVRYIDLHYHTFVLREDICYHQSQ